MGRMMYIVYAVVITVITTGLRRLTEPLTMASCSDWPSLRSLFNCDTRITPFCTAMPNSAIKQTAADTLRLIPVAS